MCPLSMMRRSRPFSPKIWRCPTTSSRLWGRISSARGRYDIGHPSSFGRPYSNTCSSPRKERRILFIPLHGKDLLNRYAEYLGNVPGQHQRGIIAPLLQVADGLPAYSHRLASSSCFRSKRARYSLMRLVIMPARSTIPGSRTGSWRGRIPPLPPPSPARC